jgi:hypothetical protein
VPVILITLAAGSHGPEGPGAGTARGYG